MNRDSNRHSPRRPAMISPLVDTLCCGGISVLVVVLALFYTWPLIVLFRFRFFFLSDVLINWPHFMASYRILYRRRENWRQHPWATIWVPLAIVTVVAGAALSAILVSDGRPDWVDHRVVDSLIPLAVVLLAWHYTGQAWGMTASFAYLGGLRMEGVERRLIRSGYRALLGYHILLYFTAPDALMSIPWLTDAIGNEIMSGCETLLSVWRGLVVATFVLGLMGFVRLARRSNLPVPVRSWLPWVAAFAWYLMIDCYGGRAFTFLLLQFFHALQYMVFPLRVELNSQRAASRSHWGSGLLLAIYYVALVVIGFAVFMIPRVENVVLGVAGNSLATIVAAGVSLHHYFIDAVIWKIRSPEVRESLFGHLPQGKVS